LFSIAPPLCAPARVIPGRTLLEVEVGLAPAPPLNLKIRDRRAAERLAMIVFPYRRRLHTFRRFAAASAA
jgi:hypothetical protein